MDTLEAHTDGSFNCLECGSQVKIVHGDKKLSYDLHQLTHNSSNTRRQEFHQTSPLLGKDNSSSSTPVPYYTCQICNEQVDILYNDVKLSLKIHSKKHNDHLESTSEDQLSNSISDTSRNSTKNNIKLKKQKVLDCTIIDDAFITLPPSLRAHRGFILRNADGIISCSICKINVDILNISEHLETKSHEDNIIMLLKNFISDELHSSLDCLGFSGSNLVCNQCICKIDLCSNNPHETIVNVFIHNAQPIHLSKKNSSNEDLKDCKSDDAQRVMQTLSKMSPEINENQAYLDFKVETNFNCRLCNQSFVYEDEFQLLENLQSHFIGQDHVNHHKAIVTLELFETSNLSSKRSHMLIVSKGSIYCKRCFSNISSDTRKMEEHLTLCLATKTNENDPFLKEVKEILKIVPSLVRSSDKKTNNVEELKNLNVENVEKKNEGSSCIKANGSIDIKRLLCSLPIRFQDVGYTVEDDDGKFVKCLVCDCRLPPAHYNLETHLTGKNHQSNEDKMKTENISFDKATSSLNVKNSETSNIIDQVFKNLARNDPLVKANDIILMDFDGIHYFCTACGDLIPASTNPDKFKTNIYHHVTSASHLHLFPNQKKIIGAKTLPKDTNVITIDQLFAAMPKDLQGDRRFIKILETNSLYCSLCKVKVPINARNLQEHLEGGYHTDLLDKLSEPQSFVSKAVGFLVSAIQDAIFQKIKLSNKLIKDNENHLFRKGKDYFCSLCSATIQNCSDLEYLTDRFLSHLEGNNHIKNVATKLMESYPDIRDERRYVKVKNQTILCTICDIALPNGFDPLNIQKHLIAHFSGNRHKNATSSPLAPSSSQLQPPTCSAMLNKPTVSGKPLTSNNSTDPRSPIDGNARYSSNPVFEAFRKVPTHLQDDMKFIKNNAIPDYLTCTLCSNTISPFALKDHLVEENHMKEKRIFEERVSQWKKRVI